MTRYLVALIVAIWANSAFPSGPSASVELFIASDKKEYSLYEPVIVPYRLQNVSNSQMQFPSSISFGTGRVTFEIAGEDMVFRPYATGPERETITNWMTVSPGESVKSQVIIVTNSLGIFAVSNPGVYPGATPFALSRPGKLFVRASASLGTQGDNARIVSNVLKVLVKIPDPSDDVRKTFPSLEDYAAAVGADYTVDDVPEAVNRWEAFIRAHPKSICAPFVAYNVATLYLHGTADRPDVSRASELYRFAAERGPSNLADDALLGIAKSQVEAKRFDDAKLTVERLLATFPNSETRSEAKRIQKGLDAGLKSLREIYSQ